MLVWLYLFLFFNSLMAFDRPLENARKVELPENLIVGYANWNQCDETILQSVKDGVNVVIWFSINLSVSSETGNPAVTNGPDMDCVAEMVRRISDLNLYTVHLISIGGWNSPHPDTTNSVEKTYEFWNYWNRQIAARPEKGFYGFDGFDWDIEGNDTPSSPYNQMTCECLDLMGRFSQLAKEKGNYIVSMAPAESYLDPTTNAFDRSLLHEYEEWIPIVPGFSYHGRNTYAYLLDRYGYYNNSSSSNLDTTTVTTTNTNNYTFDFVTIQLYEGYSHAEYNITQLHIPPTEYLISFVRSVLRGWEVDYSTDSDLQYPYKHKLLIERSRLVVGLANGWAGDGKFLLIYPEEVSSAYQILESSNEAPRGFAYWNMLDEGKCSPQRPAQPVWLAAGLNEFLHIRSNDSINEPKENHQSIVPDTQS